MTDFTEPIERPNFILKYRIKEYLHSSKSKFQKIDIIDIEEFGRVLFLDKDTQISEKDAEIYDRAIVDPVFAIKRDIKKVMIIGGGDGGVLRQALTYNIEEAVMAELDKEVIDVCKKYMPSICKNAYEDKRTKLIIGDAMKILDEQKDFDAILVDLTGPDKLANINTEEFYDNLFRKIKASLSSEGVISMQIGSYYEKNLVNLIETLLRKYFSNMQLKQIFIPCYIEPWIFGIAQNC